MVHEGGVVTEITDLGVDVQDFQADPSQNLMVLAQPVYVCFHPTSYPATTLIKYTSIQNSGEPCEDVHRSLPAHRQQPTTPSCTTPVQGYTNAGDT